MGEMADFANEYQEATMGHAYDYITGSMSDEDAFEYGIVDHQGAHCIPEWIIDDWPMDEDGYKTSLLLDQSMLDGKNIGGRFLSMGHQSHHASIRLISNSNQAKKKRTVKLEVVSEEDIKNIDNYLAGVEYDVRKLENTAKLWFNHSNCRYEAGQDHRISVDYKGLDIKLGMIKRLVGGKCLTTKQRNWIDMIYGYGSSGRGYHQVFEMQYSNYAKYNDFLIDLFKNCAKNLRNGNGISEKQREIIESNYYGGFDTFCNLVDSI